MNELRQAIATIIDLASSMLDELDDQTMTALAELLNAAAQRLAQMQQNPVEGLQPNIPQLQPGPYPSSNISRFKYDPKSKNLVIQFLGKYPNQNGPKYLYEGIPQNIFNILQRGGVAPTTSGKNAWHEWKKGVTPSLGAAAYHLIRSGGFPYRQIS
jgi:hypothetical protein